MKIKNKIKYQRNIKQQEQPTNFIKPGDNVVCQKSCTFNLRFHFGQNYYLVLKNKL
jgi:hypothetical protein